MSSRLPFIASIVFALVIASAFVLPEWAAFLYIIAIAKGFVVLGVLVLFRTGLVSFGQGLYYCAGAYAAGALSRGYGISDVVLLMIAAGVGCFILAGIVGLLVSRYRGIFFGLLSLALSMILYGVLVKSQSLGSTDGFNMLAPTVFGIKFSAAGGKLALLVAAAIAAWIACLVVHRYLHTPLGRLAEAIRDNEIRVEYMGASAQYAVWVKYVLAAVLAGIGGVIGGIAVGHIDPEMAYWTTSGEFVFIGILAGTASVLAPFLGAYLYVVLYTIAFGASPNTWQMVVGTALLLTIVFLPDGIASLVRRKAAQP